MCEIPVSLVFGARFARKHAEAFGAAPDSQLSINFWAEKIIESVRIKMGEDFTENE